MTQARRQTQAATGQNKLYSRVALAKKVCVENYQNNIVVKVTNLGGKKLGMAKFESVGCWGQTILTNKKSKLYQAQ